MAITSTAADAHWHYFLSVEADLEHLSRFIEFHEDNYSCYSIENVRMLLAAAAEVDIILQQLCRELGVRPRAMTKPTIDQYRDWIIHKSQESKSPKHQTYQFIPGFEVLAPRYGLTLHPWTNWNTPDNSPPWWRAYNKTKHQRDTHYHQASLEHVLNAVAGLFVVCLYLYHEKARFGDLVPNPRIFRPGPGRFYGMSEGGYEPGIVYYLDECAHHPSENIP